MTAQHHIGAFIRDLRERKGLSQGALAKLMGTTQSAVARMEAGKQNFTTKELTKISEALERKIVTLSDSIDFQIEGGRKLSGTVRTNYSKNGSVVLLCAALLNKGKTTLHGISRIEEVNRLIEVLISIGMQVRWVGANSVELVPPQQFQLAKLDHAAAARIRSSLMMIGPLIHLVDAFDIPHAGGCKMGNRTIAAHRYGLEELGVKIVTKETHYAVSHKRLRPRDVVLYEAGDTAANNVLMAAARIPGETTIRFAPPNYQVQELCFFLQALGVTVEGIGTTNLTVRGVSQIHRDVVYHNSEDPIESMMFISAAIVTQSTLTITRCPIDFLSVELLKLKKMGQRFRQGPTYLAENGHTKLCDITMIPSSLSAPLDKIHALPYPGINSDNLPFFVPIAIRAKGTTLIHDWMWENRAIYFTELNRLGARVDLADPHRVFVHGPTKLRGAQIVCPPALRPAMIILIGMLGAEGTSVLRNVYSINRGYEEIATRLNAIGASITVLRGQ